MKFDTSKKHPIKNCLHKTNESNNNNSNSHSICDTRRKATVTAASIQHCGMEVSYDGTSSEAVLERMIALRPFRCKNKQGHYAGEK